MELPGYDYKEGAEGLGYYRQGAEVAPASFDDFMADMRELGAV